MTQYLIFAHNKNILKSFIAKQLIVNMVSINNFLHKHSKFIEGTTRGCEGGRNKEGEAKREI